MFTRFASRTALLLSCLLLPACTALFPIEPYEEDSPAENKGPNQEAQGDGDETAEECQSYEDCLPWSNDAPVACVESQCTLLRNENCSGVLGDWRSDDAVILGSFSAYNENAEDSIAYLNFKLALDGFKSNSWPSADGISRPVALVMCNSTSELDAEDNRQAIREGADHLINTLNVPAVIPFLLPTELAEIFQEYVSGPKKPVLFLNPGAATSTLIDKNWKNLLWHVLGEPGDYVPSYIATVEEMHTLALERWGEETEVRIAVVYDSDGVDEAYRQALTKSDDFQNYVADKAANSPPLYREFSLAGGLTEVAQEVLAYQPHILLSLLGNEVGNFTSQLESSWATHEESGKPDSLAIRALPYFAFSPTAAGNAKLASHFSELWSFARTSEALTMSRYATVNALPPDSAGLRAYQKEWAAAHPTLAANQENLFDAIYSLLYAIQAAGAPANISGEQIRDGFLRMLGDSEDAEVIVGRDHVGDSLHALSQASVDSFRFTGAMGSQDYSPLTGVQRVRTVVTCLRPVAEALFEFANPTHIEEEGVLVALDESSVNGFHRECFGDFLAPATP